MRTSLLAIVIVLGSQGSLGSLGAQGSEQQLHSTVFPWTADANANAWGAVRQVVREKTPTLRELEIHISTLKPGLTPHEPHRHQHEELIIVKEGTLEAFQDGRTHRVEAGGIIFQASNELHNVRNIGSSPATYFVVAWTSPDAGK